MIEAKEQKERKKPADLDVLYGCCGTNLVRTRDNYKCPSCFRVYTPSEILDRDCYD